MQQIFETTIAGRKMKADTGKYAMLSKGAVMLSYGETVVLITANIADEPREGVDFFPLSVDYQERLYSVGKIPGGFIKREGKPTEKAILSARAIDRPIRPLFPKNFRNDVQLICTVMSVDPDNPPEILSINGCSLALGISGAPFNGPVAGVLIGRVNGEFVVNPNAAQREVSDLHLTVCSTKERVMMIEAGGNEIPEDVMIDAVKLGFNACQDIIKFQEKVIAAVGKEKMDVALYEIPEELVKAVEDYATDKLWDAIQYTNRQERQNHTDEVKNDVFEHFAETFPDAEKDMDEVMNKILKKHVRRMVLEENRRPDGRKFNEIRPLSCDVAILPRTHGSGVFQRGQTQVLTAATLGPLGDVQVLDGLGDEEFKRYIHHYNFPPFSTGEVKILRGPGRREIGHGALAERALEPVIPSEEEFPYTIRLVSEVLSSNGSTSQASVCASTLSLMDAGVPIKRPVAGIAMGLMTSEDMSKKVILTDIQGIEDFYGDMDFKVAGTEKGITAIQVDTKLQGLPEDVISSAIHKAREARMTIIKKMLETIPEPRKELSKYAPRIITLHINPDKVRDVIGPGGKTIKKIIADTGVKIDTEDDGSIYIYAADINSGDAAKKAIDDITRDVVAGEVYLGKVTRTTSFGAFVEVLPGKEGLVHISKLANERVNKVEDVVHVGDEILVKVTDIDKQGRINLSRKDALKQVDDDKKDDKK